MIYTEELDIVENELSKSDECVQNCWNVIKSFVLEKQNCKYSKTPRFKVKKLQPDAILPVKMTTGSSGYDICSITEDFLYPGEFKAIPTGLAFDIPEGFELQVRPRSGLAAKQGVTVCNPPGTIDFDYKGEVKVILINHSKSPFVISKGFRIAQIVPMKLPTIEMVETLELSTSERGENGFGSTGVKNE